MWIDRRALFCVAAASLLVNVFLGGAVLGRVFGERGHLFEEQPRVGMRPSNGALVPPRNVQALPQEDRRRFRAAMAPHRPAIRTAREAHRQARRQIEADIAAPAFDRDRILADFQALRQSNRTTEEAVDDALIDALASLPPESRAALVARTVDDKPGAPSPKP